MSGAERNPTGTGSVAEWFPGLQPSSPACVVILAATKGGSLFPLTSLQQPKHLLPVAGIPCILRLLDQLSFCTPHVVIAIAEHDEVTIPALQKVSKMQRSRQSSSQSQDVTNDQTEPTLCTLVKTIDDGDRKPHQYAKTTISVVRLTNEAFGSVDALRLIEDPSVIPKSSSIVVMPGDLVVMKNDLRLHDLFRPRTDAACTAMLVDVGKQDENGIPLKESSKAKKGGLARDEEDIEYIALSCPPSTGIGFENPLPRIIWKNSKMEVETDHDMTGSSIKLKLPKARLRHGRVTIRTDWNDVHVYSFAPWVRRLIKARVNLVNIQEDLLPLLISRQFKGKKATFGRNSSSGDSSQPNDGALSSSPPPVEEPKVAEDSMPYSVLAAVVPNDEQYKNAVLLANSISSYLYACQEVVSHGTTLPMPESSKRNGKFLSLVMDQTLLGAKINMKASIIGASCQLGAKCRLNNVVVMDNVTIGDNCSLQNTIIGPGAKLRNNCVVREVRPGPTLKLGRRPRQLSFRVRTSMCTSDAHRHLT